MGDFHFLLYSICNELRPEDVCSMQFLCRDLIPHRHQDIHDAKHLFLALQKHGLLDKDNMFIIMELLFYIQRNDLLWNKLQIKREVVQSQMGIPGKAKISRYRNLLLELKENVTNEELKAIKKNLHNKISKSKLDKVTSMLDIFIEMENTGILDENSLENLKDIFRETDENLLKKINDYENSRIGSGSPCELQENPNPTEAQLEPTKLVYKMDSCPRGICLIIKNYNFDTARQEVPELYNMKDRKGTEEDEESIRRVFTLLRFETVVYKDLKGDQILQTIQLYSKQDHEKSDCFICCILSHGNKGVVYGTDGQSVAIRVLAYGFSRLKSTSLAGKPKMFFIQACQGREYHRAVPLESDAGNVSLGCAKMEEDLTPEEPDFLLGMATMKHYLSYRHTKEGCWYIQSLCRHLEEMCPRGEDIHSILTRVNKDVSSKNDKRILGKQMPQPCATLCKKLVFPIN